MSRPSREPRTTVLLVEDDEATREHLAGAIARDPRLELAAACGSLAEGRAALDRSAPDVLLTDIGLPDGSGIELIRRARAASERTQVMVITVFGDEETVVRAIEAGAAGYLLKDGTATSIAGSIADMLGGGAPISAPIARLLLRRIAAAAPHDAPAGDPLGDAARRSGAHGTGGAPGASSTSGRGSRDGSPVGAPTARPLLSEREHEVLNLVAKGFSFPEIARLLGVSPHTVTTHVRHIYGKLEVGSRGEAVFEAVQQGLIRLGE